VASRHGNVCEVAVKASTDFLTNSLSLGLCMSMLTTACMSTIGTVRLTQVDDQPCFSVEDTLANRRNPPLLHAVGVSDVEQKPDKEVWGFSTSATSQPVLHPDSCVQYGRLPSGEQLVTPPAKLEFGRVYDVFMNASPAVPSNSIFMHNVKFCLIKDAAGAAKVHEIQWTKNMGVGVMTPVDSDAQPPQPEVHPI
jgi:hypothetical protein